MVVHVVLEMYVSVVVVIVVHVVKTVDILCTILY